MKSFFYCIIGALLCIHGVIASSEEKIKNRDVLVTELRPLIEGLWNFSGIEGEEDKKLYKIRDYVNENILTIYKESDYIDELIKKWEDEYSKKWGVENYTWRIINTEEERNSLLGLLSRRDEKYFYIMNDFAEKFNVNNYADRKKLKELSDPVFFLLNKRQVKVRKLGVLFYEKSKDDIVFQMLITSWFPLSRPGWYRGVHTRMSRSGEEFSRIPYSSEEPKYEKEKQTKMIKEWNENWVTWENSVKNIKSQKEIDECAQKLKMMTFPLIEILSLHPPKNDLIEKELCDLFFEEVYIPITASRFNIDAIRKGNNDVYLSGKIIDDLSSMKKFNTKNITRALDVLVEFMYGYSYYPVYIESNSYLQEYSLEKSNEILSHFNL